MGVGNPVNVIGVGPPSDDVMWPVNTPGSAVEMDRLRGNFCFVVDHRLNVRKVAGDPIPGPESSIIPRE